MKPTEHYLNEITEIKKMMEQSSRFLSLSGLSGVLVGIYALIGAFIAYQLIYIPGSLYYREYYSNQVLGEMLLLAAVLLVVSFVTVIWLTTSKVKRKSEKFWSPGTRMLLTNLAIPLVTGGIFMLIFLSREIYSVVAPCCLIFYGLALVNAAKYTRREIFYMGLFEIGLGLLAAVLPGMGLFFWVVGFGLVHIIYGTIMYFRYERKTANK
ncbi:hypothetical protein [Gaoshiqia sediminis]|uniref:Uncharacterized protein n=1 Tax=Gaoshiqia sediminis TaxID=2986998 RepID=A0AA42C6V9_9BACT|nr:hypothetical protein [Gaoshiqia sediminis]MCW0482944.1 hypothetical protein [Gaoshiqia sediminis]